MTTDVVRQPSPEFQEAVAEAEEQIRALRTEALRLERLVAHWKQVVGAAEEMVGASLP